MSETHEWYCQRCGYLPPSRVTFSETCDECHTPVVLHNREERDAELAALRARVAELEGERAIVADYLRDTGADFRACSPSERVVFDAILAANPCGYCDGKGTVPSWLGGKWVIDCPKCRVPNRAN